MQRIVLTTLGISHKPAHQIKSASWPKCFIARSEISNSPHHRGVDRKIVPMQTAKLWLLSGATLKHMPYCQAIVNSNSDATTAIYGQIAHSLWVWGMVNSFSAVNHSNNYFSCGKLTVLPILWSLLLLHFFPWRAVTASRTNCIVTATPLRIKATPH